MKKITIILIIVVVLALVGFIFYKNSNAAPAPVAKTQVTQNNVDTSVSYTLDEVVKHSVKTDCWIAINGKVYNATDFIASGMHNDKILNGCGKDASEMFAQIPKHASGKAQDLLAKQLIGSLK